MCIKKNRDSQNVVILVPKINIKVTPRLLNIKLPYNNIILSHFEVFVMIGLFFMDILVSEVWAIFV